MRDRSRRVHVEHELADICIYLLRLSDVLGVNLERAVDDKLAENARKYPADKVRGSARKYTDYQGDET